MTRGSDGSEPAWKGLLSWGTLILVVFAGAFWFTIVKPEEIRMYPGEGLVPGTVANESEMMDLFSQKVLTDVDQMEPSRLMREGQTDDAIGAARDLINKDKWNVRNLMCAGNVFAAAPKENALNEEGYNLLLTSTYLCPQSKYVRLNYARALGRGGRFEEATKQYDKVVKANMDTLPSLELARLYMSNGDEDKAIKLLTAIMEKDPENSSAQKLLGIAGARNHDEKAGYEDYIKGFALERTAGYPLEARDLVDRNHDSVSDAIKEQRTTADAEPTEVEPKLLLVEMLIVQGDLTGAQSVLDAEKTKNKDNAELHRLYAELYHQSGKEEQAYQEWLTANTLEKQTE